MLLKEGLKDRKRLNHLQSRSAFFQMMFGTPAPRGGADLAGWVLVNRRALRSRHCGFDLARKERSRARKCLIHVSARFAKDPGKAFLPLTCRFLLDPCK